MDGRLLYECKTCKETFETELELRTHAKKVHVNNKFVCKFCDLEIPRKVFPKHMKDSHDLILDLTSEENSKNKKRKKKKTSETYPKNLQNLSPLDPFELLCRVEINEIKAKSVNLSFEGVECQICKQMYSNEINLRKHMYNVHKMTRVKCKVCDKEVNKKSLERHMRSVHSANILVRKDKKPISKEEKIPCVLCDKKCCSLLSLQNHIKTVHEAEQFKCSQCDFEGIRKQVEKHMKKEHNDEVHQCPKCQKILKSKTTLKEHMWIHTDDRRFICDICGMRFKRTSNYHGHLKSHQEKKFQCQLCGNFFLRKRYLAIHEQTIHNYYGEGVPPQEKGYQCEVCGIKLRWKNNLLAHMRIHTGEKPYKCKICGDDFTCHGSLRTHMAKHAICPAPSQVSSVFIQQAYLENRTESNATLVPSLFTASNDPIIQSS